MLLFIFKYYREGKRFKLKRLKRLFKSDPAKIR